MAEAAKSIILDKFGSAIVPDKTVSRGILDTGPINGVNPPVEPLVTLGVDGAKTYNGYVDEDPVRKLNGVSGRAIYREMAEDDTIGAVLFASEMMIKNSVPSIEPAQQTFDGVEVNEDEAQKKADWLNSVLFEDDMEYTWSDTLEEILTMNIYGWQYSEMCFKLRNGVNYEDRELSSKFNDGTLGLKGIENRPQETLHKWEIIDGKLLGMWQNPPTTSSLNLRLDLNRGVLRYIPIEKALHFRTKLNKNSPEGKSLLRRAYRPWYYKRNVEETEAIAIERELKGLPVWKIPAATLKSEEAKDIEFVAACSTISRDLKFNNQAGITIPSDMYKDDDGKVSSQPLVSFELLSAGNGRRAIDTDVVIRRWSNNIARTLLADFLLMGGVERSSLALSSNLMMLFIDSLESILQGIVDELNRKLVPTLWDQNGFDPAYMPKIVMGPVAPEDIEKLSAYLKNLADAGLQIFPDEALEAELRTRGGLKERRPEDYISPEDLIINQNNTNLNPVEGDAPKKEGTPKKATPNKVTPNKLDEKPVKKATFSTDLVDLED